jgi:colicin import membrane protein
MFSVLREENKVERRAEKLKLFEEQKALEERTKSPEPVVTVMDEVKGRSWADVDSDDETPHAAAGAMGIPDDSSDEDDEGEPEEEEDEENEAAGSVVSETKSNEPKPEAAPKQLSKKEKAALKKQELDDLDDVLAEFGVEATAAPTQQEGSKKKKKKANDASKDGTPELSEVEKGGVSASPEPSEPESKEVDENAKEEALKKLTAKGKGKGKGGAKSDKKSGISTAAEEAKKRAKNAAKPKKDKNAFDR